MTVLLLLLFSAQQQVQFHAPPPLPPHARCVPAPFSLRLLATTPPACGAGRAATACHGGANGPPRWRCVPCAAGRHAPAGTVARVGAEACARCAPGRAQPRAGQAQCARCPAGKLAPPDHLGCALRCQPGQFVAGRGRSGAGGSSGAGARCAACPQGKFVAAGAAARGARSCSACSCPAGHLPASRRLCRCVACRAGRFLQLHAPGGASCTACPAGKYQARRASARCERCAANAVALERAARRCTDCAPGWFAPRTRAGGGTLPCAPCAAGRFGRRGLESAGAWSACEACPLGKFQQRAGRTGCGACPCGRFTSLDRRHCTTVGEVGQALTVAHDEASGQDLTQRGCELRLRDTWRKARRVTQQRKQALRKHAAAEMQALDAMLAQRQQAAERKVQVLLEQQQQRKSQRFWDESSAQQELRRHVRAKARADAAARAKVAQQRAKVWRSIAWRAGLVLVLLVPVAALARCWRYGLHRHLLGLPRAAVGSALGLQ